jgi:carbon starvation protein
VLGIPERAGVTFGLLAISTFLLTTLDTATRLARYVAEELLGRRDWFVKAFATAATLGLPLLIVSSRVEMNGAAVPAYKLIWPLFGSTNQLLAGLALLTITVWLRRSGTRPAGLLVTLLPMVFMIGVTLLALGQILLQAAASGDGLAETANAVKFGAAAMLLLLAVFVIVEAFRSLRGTPETGLGR